MPQFLDDLLVTTSLRMQRFTLDPGDTRFTACFTVEAGPLRLVKEFDFSDHPDASGSLRRLADAAFAAWLRALTAGLAAGTAASAVQIDVVHSGWARVVLRGDHGDLGEVMLDVPETDDFRAMEIGAMAKLGETLNRALLRHEQDAV